MSCRTLRVALIPILLLACDAREPSTRLIREYHASHPEIAKREYYVMVDDTTILHGPKRIYDTVGRIGAYLHFEHGIKQGPFALFRSDGSIEIDGQMEDGEIDGMYYEYHDNLRPSRQRLFRGGRLVAIVLQNDSSGAALDRGSIKDGEGIARDYGVSGNLVKSGPYVNGRREGLWLMFSSEGYVMDTLKYYDGWRYSPENIREEYEP